MAEHRTDAERRREVEGWRASGEGPRQYAAKRGYAESTLRNWARTVEPTPSSSWVTPALVRLVRGSMEAVPAEAELIVEVGAAKIRVRRGFDPALLRGVVLAITGGQK